MTSRQTRLQSAGLVLTSAISSQIGATFAVRLIEHSSPSVMVWLRTVAACIFLWCFALVRRGSERVSRRLAIELGLIIALTNTMFYQAIARVPLGDTVAIEYLGPITIAFLASNRRRDVLWIVAAVSGVLAISQRTAGPLDAVGLLFVAGASIGWSLYVVVGRRVAQSNARARTLALAMSVGAVALLLPAGTQSHGFTFTPALIAGGVVVGLMSSAIPYTVELTAMGKVSATVIGVLLSLQPLMAALAGLVLLGQAVSMPEAAGFILITTAALGVALTTSAVVIDPTGVAD